MRKHVLNFKILDKEKTVMNLILITQNNFKIVVFITNSVEIRT